AASTVSRTAYVSQRSVPDRAPAVAAWIEKPRMPTAMISTPAPENVGRPSCGHAGVLTATSAARPSPISRPAGRIRTRGPAAAGRADGPGGLLHEPVGHAAEREERPPVGGEQRVVGGAEGPAGHEHHHVTGSGGEQGRQCQRPHPTVPATRTCSAALISMTSASVMDRPTSAPDPPPGGRSCWLDGPMTGQFENKFIVIVGAGPGFGRTLALSAAREGATVVVAARTASRLEELAEEIRAEGGTA